MDMVRYFDIIVRLFQKVYCNSQLEIMVSELVMVVSVCLWFVVLFLMILFEHLYLLHRKEFQMFVLILVELVYQDLITIDHLQIKIHEGIVHLPL